MKKIITTILALAMISAMSINAFAAELNQDSNPKTQDTEITTAITPSYVVTIPADTTIDFNSQSTPIGTIKATKMQIEPNKVVEVKAEAGELKNDADESKTIPFKLTKGTEEFTVAQLFDTTTESALAVDITEDDWNKAYAGSYTGTITFTVSYIDATIG